MLNAKIVTPVKNGDLEFIYQVLEFTFTFLFIAKFYIQSKNRVS